MKKVIIRRLGEKEKQIEISAYIFKENNEVYLEGRYSYATKTRNYLLADIEEDDVWDIEKTYLYESPIANEITSSVIRATDSNVGGADAITESLSLNIFNQLKNYYRNSIHHTQLANSEIVFVIGDNELWIEKPYAINGIKMPLKEIASKLSRVIQAYGNIEERHPKEQHRAETKKAIRRIMKTPEDILYCLENRVPFYFFVGGKQEKVRLNLRQIGASNYAIEISDGKWGEIKENDLTTYLGHYLHGSNRGGWKLLSPSKLFYKTMGKLPMDSEEKVMVAFLLQNRTQDIVEKRAKELIDDMAIQFKESILVIPSVETGFGDDEGGRLDANGVWRTPMKVLVKGQKTDWLLVESVRNYGNENNPQRVHTYCLMTEYFATGEINETKWNGPICINTGGKNPSLGDQFASRIFSLMNDSSVSQRVNTISDYMTCQENRIRIPLKEEFSNEDKRYEYNKMLGMSIQ